MGATAKKAAGVAGIGAIAFGLADVTSAAIKFQSQQALLRNALKNVGQDSSENVRRITEAADTLATHGGFDPSTSIAGMQRLVTATGSVSKAIRDETLVTDLSRAAHISNIAATRAIINIENGRTTGLARLGLAQVKVTTAMDALTASHKKITPEMRNVAKQQDAQASKLATLRLLWQRFGGAATAYSHSAAGAASNFRNSVEVLSQKVGVILLPIIMKLVTALTKVVEWLGKNKVALDILLAAIGAVAAAWVAMQLAFLADPIVAGIAAVIAVTILVITHFKAIKAWVVQNFPIVAAAIAVLLGPFGLIIDAVLFVVMHFKDFKNVAIAVFNVVKRAAIDVFTVLKTVATVAFTAIKVLFAVFLVYWKVGFGTAKFIAQVTFAILLALAKVAFAGIKAVALFLFNNVLKPGFTVLKTIATAVFGVVRSVGTTAFNAISTVIGAVWGVLKTVFGWIKTAWQAIGGVLQAPFNALAGAVRSVFNTVKGIVVDAINGLISLYNNTIGQLPFAPHITPIGGSSGPPPNSGRTAGIGRVDQSAFLNTPFRGGRAMGGPAALSGMYRVGEQGPEDVYLPAGSYVQPNNNGQQLDGDIVFKVGEIEFARAAIRSLTKLKAVS